MTRAHALWASWIVSIGINLAIITAAGVLVGAIPVAVAAVESTASTAASTASTSAGRVQFHLRDPRIDEASGIGVGIRSPGVVYVQNDSGDTNRFFAIDARSGSTVATVTVRGARNVDWEDLAVAPDAAGMPSVWLADTGDNDTARDSVTVYRVDEPSLHRDSRGLHTVTGAADVWRLRYPGGPVDAESLAVSPSGVAYLVTKSLTGRSQVYRLPATPDARRVRSLTRVGAIRFRPTGTADPFGVIGQLTATGASMSTDGTLLTVRTYSDAWFWRVRDGDISGALRDTATHIALPRQQQGEGIAFDGNTDLLIDSEGIGTRVWSVPVPASLVRRGASASSSSGPDQSVTPSSARSATTRAARSGAGGGDNGSRTGVTVIFVLALAIIVAACGANRVRVRRGRRDN